MLLHDRAIRYAAMGRIEKSVFISEYTLPARQYQKIASDVAARCAKPDARDPRTSQFCEQLSRDRETLQTAGCPHSEEPKTGNVRIINYARTICSMTEFQIFDRQLRILMLELPIAKMRSGEEVISYLGELVAAQNYSSYPFTPTVFFYINNYVKRRNVPLFVVKRGTPAPNEAAVALHYNGETFYIPKPNFGAADEARSLEVLDFASEIITRASRE
jgi:hypothetical protein